MTFCVMVSLFAALLLISAYPVHGLNTYGFFSIPLSIIRSSLMIILSYI
jgi:hypothetical protein